MVALMASVALMMNVSDRTLFLGTCLLLELQIVVFITSRAALSCSASDVLMWDVGDLRTPLGLENFWAQLADLVSRRPLGFNNMHGF